MALATANRCESPSSRRRSGGDGCSVAADAQPVENFPPAEIYSSIFGMPDSGIVRVRRVAVFLVAVGAFLELTNVRYIYRRVGHLPSVMAPDATGIAGKSVKLLLGIDQALVLFVIEQD